MTSSPPTKAEAAAELFLDNVRRYGRYRTDDGEFSACDGCGEVFIIDELNIHDTYPEELVVCDDCEIDLEAPNV